MAEKTARINDLPAGWIQTHLEDVCDIILGQSPPSETYNTTGKGLPFFQGKAEFTELHPIAEKWCSVPGKIAEKNDILLSVRAPVGDTNIADRRCCIGRGLAALRYNHYKFLFYYMRSIEKELDKKGTGSTFKAISGEIVRNTNFPLPPLPEQHRIVAKIEELFSELDKGVEALKTAQQQLKVYRQAVLKWAFEGTLTEEWRESNKSKIEPASVLMERIKEERTKGSNSKYKEVKLPDILELPALPDGWLWASSSELCSSVRDGTHDTPKYVDIGIPLITSKNLKGKGLDFSTAKNISIEDHKQINVRSGVEEGDILFAMIGTIGNPVVVKSERAFSIKNVALFKKNPPFIIPEYLKYWFEGLVFDKLLEKKKYLKGTTQRFIPLEYLRILPIPFCCCQEQNQIVAEIESRLSVADKIEESITQSLKQAEALRQSILKKAFSGKLVPQDPNNEPAEKLLARIKKEKAAQAPVKGTVKGERKGKNAS